MTREEHFIKKTKLLAQIDSAEKLGCKNVLKCAKLELAKLESKYKKEHLSNPLFSYMVTRKEMDKLIEDKVNPTFQIRVTFKSGEVYEIQRNRGFRWCSSHRNRWWTSEQDLGNTASD